MGGMFDLPMQWTTKQPSYSYFFTFRFMSYEVKVALDKGLVETTKKFSTWPPKGIEIRSEDICCLCDCCKYSCQCEEKLEKAEGSHFVSQLKCGGTICSFEISVFKGSGQ